MEFCEKCGRSLNPGALFCGHCGNPVDPRSVQVSTARAVPPIPPEYRSAPVVSSAGPQSPVYTPISIPRGRRSGLRYFLWIGGGLAVVVALVLVAAFFFGAGRGIERVSEQQGAESGGAGPGTPPVVSQTPAPPVINLGAMQTVMKRDDNNRAELEASVKAIDFRTEDDIDKVATLIRGYVANAEQVDTSACPRDFAEAYERHLSAWTVEADMVSAHPHIPQGDEAFFEGFLRGMNGDASGGTLQLQDQMSDWMKRLQEKNADVDRLQGELNAVAVRYGAR